MLVLVRGLPQWEDGPHETFVDVPESHQSHLREMAFRFVYMRRERDFNELVHRTMVIDSVKVVSSETASVLSRIP